MFLTSVFLSLSLSLINKQMRIFNKSANLKKKGKALKF